MKHCPKCGSNYDDSWGICLKDSSALISVAGDVVRGDFPTTDKGSFRADIFGLSILGWGLLLSFWILASQFGMGACLPLAALCLVCGLGLLSGLRIFAWIYLVAVFPLMRMAMHAGEGLSAPDTPAYFYTSPEDQLKFVHSYVFIPFVVTTGIFVVQLAVRLIGKMLKLKHRSQKH